MVYDFLVVLIKLNHTVVLRLQMGEVSIIVKNAFVMFIIQKDVKFIFLSNSGIGYIPLTVELFLHIHLIFVGVQVDV